MAFSSISTTLRLGDWDGLGAPYHTYLRYDNVILPTNITSSRLELTKAIDNSGTDPLTCVIAAEAADDPAAPTTANEADTDWANRTTAEVDWTFTQSIIPVDATMITPDISIILEEIKARSGWVNGQAILLMLHFDFTADQALAWYAENNVATPDFWPRLYINGSVYPTGLPKVVLNFYVPGTLVVGAHPQTLKVPQGMVIEDVRLVVGTAPTGANIIVDVNKNGSSMFLSSTRPTILTGQTEEFIAQTPASTVLLDTDLIQCDIDQVGSTVAGADLSIEVRGFAT